MTYQELRTATCRKLTVAEKADIKICLESKYEIFNKTVEYLNPKQLTMAEQICQKMMRLHLDNHAMWLYFYNRLTKINQLIEKLVD